MGLRDAKLGYGKEEKNHNLLPIILIAGIIFLGVIGLILLCIVYPEAICISLCAGIILIPGVIIFWAINPSKKASVEPGEESTSTSTKIGLRGVDKREGIEETDSSDSKSTSTNEERRCWKCKTLLRETDKYCPNCGKTSNKPIIGLITTIIFVGIILWQLGVFNVSDTSSTHTSYSGGKDLGIVSSYSIDDLDSNWCSSTMTDLQRDSAFKRLNGKTIQWNGEVMEVSESFGTYSLQVKHCRSSLSSDIIVYLKDSEKNKALTLQKGMQVTYKARLSGWGSILGLRAEDGEIVNQ